MAAGANEARSRMVVDAVARQISDFELEPGERLTEEGLAKRYEVSRTPVREALTSLQEMGLVERLPAGGYAVRVVRLETVADLMVIWATLEELVIRLVARNADRASLERLLAQARDETSGDPMVEEQIHSELARLSGNQELVRLLGTIYSRTGPYRRLDGLNRRDEIHTDHVRILELLVDDHAEDARELMREHVERSHRFVEMLLRGGVRSVSFDASA
ncbi:GntR family transcriptional regulator [Pseudonocardia endophytica]|uniref:GntR family transcriptional regulator n=1 Tax=Pseudonocardia endophytica TaxID=401976 RepID=A0A4R1HVT8_PSEEN|nr:GntR family transcriptional regulator [Pseudonocardia endophytica]TCK25543.1 GntR family transcriptional regulator [Pseudonocardia endophytica]